MSIIEDAAQLVKYNSIQGNKMNDIDVVYTMWGNLHKTEGMEVGQVDIPATISRMNKKLRRKIRSKKNLIVLFDVVL